MVGAQHDQRHRLERGREKLIEARVRICPLDVGIDFQGLGQVAVENDLLVRPPGGAGERERAGQSGPGVKAMSPSDTVRQQPGPRAGATRCSLRTASIT